MHAEACAVGDRKLGQFAGPTATVLKYEGHEKRGIKEGKQPATPVQKYRTDLSFIFSTWRVRFRFQYRVPRANIRDAYTCLRGLRNPSVCVCVSP